jgi:hypothetical protein
MRHLYLISNHANNKMGNLCKVENKIIVKLMLTQQNH